MPYRGPQTQIRPARSGFDEGLDAALAAFQLVDTVKRQRAADAEHADDRRRRISQEDEDRAVARLTRSATDLSQRGARTLADHLADPLAGNADGPITPDSLRRIGNAEETGVMPEFSRPEPEQTRIPTGDFTRSANGLMLPDFAQRQDPAPYFMPSGAVMDPSAARRGNELDAALAQQGEPWTPRTREEQLQFEEDRERRRATGSGLYHDRMNRSGSGNQPSLTSAIDSILKMYGSWNEDRGAYDPPEGADQQWVLRAARALQTGQQVPAVPTPLRTARPIEAAPPEGYEPPRSRSLWDRIGAIFGGGDGSDSVDPGFRRTAPSGVDPGFARRVGADPDPQFSVHVGRPRPARPQPPDTAPAATTATAAQDSVASLVSQALRMGRSEADVRRILSARGYSPQEISTAIIRARAR